jgi:hypothetical protein
VAVIAGRPFLSCSAALRGVLRCQCSVFARLSNCVFMNGGTEPAQRVKKRVSCAIVQQ